MLSDLGLSFSRHGSVSRKQIKREVNVAQRLMLLQEVSVSP